MAVAERARAEVTVPRTAGILAALIFVAYMLLATAAMLWQGIEVLPDRYAGVLLVGSLVIKRTRRFLTDWLPFLFLLISYDYLRGFADDFGRRVNYIAPIDADLAIFGELPTASLQAALLGPEVQWYDLSATALYFAHFAVPLGFAALLWLPRWRAFQEFVASLTLLSYAAWVTYVVFPVAPPWLAVQNGYITGGIDRVLERTFALVPRDQLDLPTLYHSLNPNPVAAIPSLHAAYPFLVLLVAVRAFGKGGLVVAPYVAAVFFVLVYLGEHYAVDVLLGVVYATVAFIAAPRIISWAERGLAAATLRLSRRRAR